MTKFEDRWLAVQQDVDNKMVKMLSETNSVKAEVDREVGKVTGEIKELRQELDNTKLEFQAMLDESTR